MQNINMGIGISKQFCTYKLRQLSALVCMCLLVSCTSYVTYTDYYCITNYNLFGFYPFGNVG